MKAAFVRINEIRGPSISPSNNYSAWVSAVPGTRATKDKFYLYREKLRTSKIWDFYINPSVVSALEVKVKQSSLLKSTEIGRIQIPLAWLPCNAVVADWFPLMAPPPKPEKKLFGARSSCSNSNEDEDSESSNTHSSSAYGESIDQDEKLQSSPSPPQATNNECSAQTQIFLQIDIHYGDKVLIQHKFQAPNAQLLVIPAWQGPRQQQQQQQQQQIPQQQMSQQIYQQNISSNSQQQQIPIVVPTVVMTQQQQQMNMQQQQIYSTCGSGGVSACYIQQQQIQPPIVPVYYNNGGDVAYQPQVPYSTPQPPQLSADQPQLVIPNETEPLSTQPDIPPTFAPASTPNYYNPYQAAMNPMENESVNYF